MRKILAVALAVLLVAGCDSKPDAPFGLKWSSNIGEFPSKDLLTVNRVPLAENSEMIYTTTVPQGGLGDGGYRFYFHDGKLNRIEFNTYDETNDSAGEKAKIKYETLKAKLVEKYGEPSKIDEHVYSDDFRFIPCVTNEHCGRWESIFIKDDTIAKVSIEMGLTEDGYKKTSESSMVKVEFTPK